MRLTPVERFVSGRSNSTVALHLTTSDTPGKAAKMLCGRTVTVGTTYSPDHVEKFMTEFVEYSNTHHTGHCQRCWTRHLDEITGGN